MSVVINGIEYVPKLKMQSIDGMTFGLSLKTMRKQLKMSLDVAALEIGCSKSHLWELEHDRTEPGLRMASAIASAYGVPVAVLAACLNWTGA
jgi:transcriptional regulator with XRE-family HTH domain